MYVCKAFYQQFEWATNLHWEAVSDHPVLICTGNDDKVTPIIGAQALQKFLLSQSIGKELAGVTMTENAKERNGGNSTKSESHKSINADGKVRFFVIRNAGHHVLEEQPEQLAGLMDSFFGEACGLSLFRDAAVR